MQFTKGIRDKLEKYVHPQKEMEIVMEISGTAVYDFCCFGLDPQNRLSDERYMVFYNQPQSPEGAVCLTGTDNCTGRIRVNLNQLPEKIQRLAFTVSVDGSTTMAEVSKVRISIVQPGAEGVFLQLSGKDFSSEKAVIGIELYKKDVWRVAAVANGFNDGLPALLSYFGSTGKIVLEKVKSEPKKTTKSSRVRQQIKVKVASSAAAGDERKEAATSENGRYGTDIPEIKGKEKDIAEARRKEADIQESKRKEADVQESKRKETDTSETINGKPGSHASTKVYFQYNPYTVESKIQIDGMEVKPPNRLYDLRNERIQVWLDQLMPILIEVCNDSSFAIDFYGLRLDYEDLAEVLKEYGRQHPEIELYLHFTEAKGSADRLNELKDLFAQMQKDCPFEDLKTKQIQENFDHAVSAEFEVSVIATMSSGKSTLINALLGRELMPSKNEACTATIARIKDSEQNQFRAVYRDRENRILGQYDHLTLKDMEEMNANPATAYIDMEGNIPNIDSSGIKLVLVDTPGPNNSRTEEHKNHTYKVIKEKTKPMVLYVLNATQLQTNDDYQLLSTVAEAMKVGGKQSKDRFIFAVNKIDQFDPDKESVQDALEHVREYLKKFDIVHPNIFPTSAETAKVIRMQQGGAVLTKGQNKVLMASNYFIEEKQLHLSEQASLSRNNQMLVKEAVEKAQAEGDTYQEILLHTGIPAVEYAINEYLKKYAYTTKIKSAVDTFKKKVEEKDMHARMLTSIQNNEKERNEIHQRLENIKRILDDGREAGKFRGRIEALDMMKDAKKRIRDVRAKISKELTPASSKGAMTTLEVQQMMMKLNMAVQHLQSDVKTELDNIINDVIIENANAIMAEYREHLHDLIECGMLESREYGAKQKSGVNFLEMDIPNAQEIINSYKYNERYDTGEEEWVENTAKKWYKPWTWFQESGHYRTIYANREMVDYATVENEYLTPVIRGFMENVENAQRVAQEEAEGFKQFFLQELSKLEAALKKKVEENEKLTQNQSNIENRLNEERENIQWLEKFMARLDQILEI